MTDPTPELKNFNQPPNLRELSAAIGEMDAIREKSLSRLFGAIAAHESLEEDAPEDTPWNDLTVLDTVTTQRGIHAFDRDLVSLQYQTVLEQAGLAGGKESFAASLLIKDGAAFSRVLEQAVQSSEKTSEQAAQFAPIVDGMLLRMSRPYVSDPYDPENPDKTYYMAPHLLDEKLDSEADRTAYGLAVDQLLPHAERIAESLDALGDNSATGVELRAAALAEKEGLLAEWAVAYDWGLLQAPTDRVDDLVWTQWHEPSDFKMLTDFLTYADIKAPEKSKYLKQIAEAMVTNIRKVEAGDFIPSLASSLGPATSEIMEDDEDLLDLGPVHNSNDEPSAGRQDYERLLKYTRQWLEEFAVQHG